MLEFAQKAVATMAGRSLVDFASSETTIFAEAYLIGMIGESANQVPREVQERLPSIPWSEIIGMRHRVIHGYDTLDVDALHYAAINDLPVLIRELTEFLSHNDPSSFTSQE
jgi:uncharacterized protein with HEPN domain